MITEESTEPCTPTEDNNLQPDTVKPDYSEFMLKVSSQMYTTGS